MKQSGLTKAPVRPTMPTPSRLAERIGILDFLRGVAILGILPANILSCALPSITASTFDPKHMPVMDATIRLLIVFFVESKFMTIFWLLFGVGLAIQGRRLVEQGQPMWGLLCRRLLALFAFGVLHLMLLWYGDILSKLAALGLLSLVALMLLPRTIFTMAATLFVVPLAAAAVVTASATAQMGGVPGAESSSGVQSSGSQASAIDANVRKMETSMAQQTKLTAPVRARSAGSDSVAAQERRIYRTGTFRQMLEHRVALYTWHLRHIGVVVEAFRGLAVLWLGIWIARSGMLHAIVVEREFGNLAARWGLAAGTVFQGATVALMLIDRTKGWLGYTLFACFYIGSFALAVGYLGVVATVFRKFGESRWVGALMSVGRMSLTNYLLQSILCTTVFYGYGFGLFGQIGFPALMGITIIIWYICVIFSLSWLRYFQFGPFEWIWRGISYWRIEPMRVRGAVNRQGAHDAHRPHRSSRMGKGSST